MRQTITKSRYTNGFTLVELLIAVAIFAIVALVAGTGLRSVLMARDVAEESADRLSELQRGMNIIQGDIEQIVNRKVRDEYGDTLPAIEGSASDGYIIFTRTGVQNPLKLRRSSLQRVAYLIDDTELIRQAWYYVDGAIADTAQETILITEVDTLEFAFLDSEEKWEEQWPTSTLDQDDEENAPAPSPVPKGIELRLNLIDHGEITRLFIVPGGDAKWD
ncbi:MAG: type II secretion system protein GspJ [Gammaproteobacteria bacterium]|nr:MAG: type II secretion system protein GspJ [Gammaproteobacteria bacterium]